jgi:hypothetical protein
VRRRARGSGERTSTARFLSTTVKLSTWKFWPTASTGVVTFTSASGVPAAAARLNIGAARTAERSASGKRTVKPCMLMWEWRGRGEGTRRA